MSKSLQPPPPQIDYEPLPDEVPNEAPPPYGAFFTAEMAKEMALALLANPRLDQIIGTTRTDPVALAQALHDYCHRAATTWVALQREAAQ